MPRANLISLFAEFRRYSRDVAVVQRRGYRREAWTYGRLAGVAFACERELQERGVRTGDRVLVWGPNSAEWMAAFWGCLLRGAVAVPLDGGATIEFAGRVARETSAKLVIAAREKPALEVAVPVLKLEELADLGRRPRVVATAHVRGESPRPIYESLADEPLTRQHIAQILFTSGTTAEPRGVVLTHGNFLANLEPLERGIAAYRKYEKWFHPLRLVTLVPLGHVFGQFMALFVPPLLGATVVFEHSTNPAEIMRTIKRERGTALIAVPRMLDGLRAGVLREFAPSGRDHGFADLTISARGRKFLRRAWMFRKVHRHLGWKFWAFISGGAALSGETEEFFKRMGYAVVQGYGMTETASLISLNHPFRAAQGSIGKVLPGREFRLAEDGEILVRGENVASGYWEAGALRPSEEQGWLCTGDVGELDTEGNLRFRGRKKNVIVTPAGLNVYPEDLESALRKQSGVRDCVVVPIERGGNAEACAVLLLDEASGSGALPRAGFSLPSSLPAAERETPRPEDRCLQSDATARQAVESANKSLAEYQRMRSWVVWPEADFPRTPTGKPKLAPVALAAMRMLGGWQSESTANVAAASPRERIFSGSANRLEDLLERFRVPGDANNHIESELNLSSLDRVELLSALEERYRVELNETAFAEAQTVSDVERLLREPGARRTEYVYPRWAQREAVRWFRLAIYYALVWPATQILGHPRILGRENLRGVRGPVLIVANHSTRRADIGLILAALPGRFRHRVATAMGGETLQQMRRPPGRWFFAKRWAYQLGYWLVTALFNVFPLPQFSGFRESFRYAGETVDRGYSVLVFPEGQVNDSETGEMAKFRGGIGMLAENLRVTIVPMRLDGVWAMKRERRRLARIGEITVRIGAPVTFPPGMAADQIAETLESVVRSL
jgi:long-chain acyl-CoA synthetase